MKTFKFDETNVTSEDAWRKFENRQKAEADNKGRLKRLQYPEIINSSSSNLKEVIG